MDIALSEKARALLLVQGYILSDTLGSPYCRDEFGVGLLISNPIPPQTGLFGLVTKKQPMVFVGVLWFDNPTRKAYDGRWVLSVYGQQYLQILENQAEHIATTLQTNIICILASAEPRFEYTPQVF